MCVRACMFVYVCECLCVSVWPVNRFYSSILFRFPTMGPINPSHIFHWTKPCIYLRIGPLIQWNCQYDNNIWWIRRWSKAHVPLPQTCIQLNIRITWQAMPDASVTSICLSDYLVNKSIVRLAREIHNSAKKSRYTWRDLWARLKAYKVWNEGIILLWCKHTHCIDKQNRRTHKSGPHLTKW